MQESSQWLQEDAQEPGSTEQRRLRHLSEILIRNLDVSALYERPRTTVKPARNRLSWLEGSAAAAAGNAVASTSRRPKLPSRTSRDDIDLHLPPALQRRNSARRTRALSNLAWSAQTNGDATLNGRATSSDKGKGKAREAIEEDAVHEEYDGAATQDRDDSEVVFGWMSASNPALTRSKSRSSVKSTSSRRSSSSFGKRLLRHAGAAGGRHNLRDSDEDDDDPDVKPSRPSLSPSATHNHVSFQVSDVPPAFPASLSVNSIGGRNRSASRGSMLSIASGSSSSTVRHIHSLQRSLPQHDDRQVREKRQALLRNHLVKSRITLSLVQEDLVFPPPQSNGTSSKPQLSRSRTISLPLSPAHQATTNASAFAKGGARSEPFFTAPSHSESMDPSFTIDQIDYRVEEGRLATLQSCDRILLGIWVQPKSTRPIRAEVEGGDPPWSLLTEVEVSFRDLVSLGSDPLLFPDYLPSNTTIFKFTNTGEYYSARLPAFLPSQRPGDDEGGTSAASDAEADDPDGNLSDPGPATLSRSRGRKAAVLIGRDKREREKLIARRRMVVERSLRETKMLQSADEELLERIIHKEADVAENRTEISGLARRISKLLEEPAIVDDRYHGQKEHALHVIQQDLRTLNADIAAISQERQRRRDSLQERRSRLANAEAWLKNQHTAIEMDETGLNIDKSVLASVRMSLVQRQAHLVSELAIIFPVDAVDSANLLFSICGLALPNASVEAKPSASLLKYRIHEDSMASAFGYVAQAVTLLAAYLAVPLYYPLRCVGSRSLVQDPISQIKGSKIFPLYSKGVDKYRFDYAVFLLNKDIEQLMIEADVMVLDLRQTLPNLKNLYLTLSTDASQPKRSTIPKKRDTIGLGSPLRVVSPTLGHTQTPAIRKPVLNGKGHANGGRSLLAHVSSYLST